MDALGRRRLRTSCLDCGQVPDLRRCQLDRLRILAEIPQLALEAVAALRHRLDEVFAAMLLQSLAQQRDVPLQAAFLDEGVWPEARDQLLFRHHAAAILD